MWRRRESNTESVPCTCQGVPCRMICPGRGRRSPKLVFDARAHPRRRGSPAQGCSGGRKVSGRSADWTSGTRDRTSLAAKPVGVGCVWWSIQELCQRTAIEASSAHNVNHSCCGLALMNSLKGNLPGLNGPGGRLYTLSPASMCSI